MVQSNQKFLTYHYVHEYGSNNRWNNEYYDLNGTIEEIIINNTMIKNVISMPSSINIYTSKILYHSNRDTLDYQSVRGDGSKHQWNNEDYDFKRYKQWNKFYKKM